MLLKLLGQEAIGGKFLTGTPAAALRLKLEVWLAAEAPFAHFFYRRADAPKSGPSLSSPKYCLAPVAQASYLNLQKSLLHGRQH